MVRKASTGIDFHSFLTFVIFMIVLEMILITHDHSYAPYTT